MSTTVEAGFAGRTVLVKQGSTVVAGIRTKTLTFDGEPIDVTSDENDGWRTLLSVYGTRGLTASVEGVVKSHQLKIAALSQAVMTELTLTWPDGFEVVGDFAIANYSETGTYDDAMTFSCEFRSSGEVAYDTGVALALDPPAGPLSASETTPFTDAITVTGGTAPYMFTISSGMLPDGLTFNTSGEFSGSPAEGTAGTYPLTIRAVDAAMNSVTASYSLEVTA